MLFCRSIKKSIEWGMAMFGMRVSFLSIVIIVLNSSVTYANLNEVWISNNTFVFRIQKFKELVCAQESMKALIRKWEYIQVYSF